MMKLDVDLGAGPMIEGFFHRLQVPHLYKNDEHVLIEMYRFW